MNWHAPPHRPLVSPRKEELLKLAYKQLDQAAELLKAAGEELLAEEADALAVKVSPKRPFTLS
jgi:hypothetical protein